MKKWESLTNYLNGVPNEITLTWAELDEIIGGMPASATNYRAWWSGDRTHIQSWKSAGFDVANLQMGSQVTFARRGSVSAVVSSKTIPTRSMLSVVEQADAESVAADIDSRSWVNIKRPETAAKKNRIKSLFGKVTKTMTVADSLQRAGFTDVCPIDIERDSTGIPIKDFPQNRYENHGHVRLNTHGKGPFCRLNLQKALSDGPGLYAITVDDSVVYIGECENLRRMFGSLGYGVIQPSSCFVGGQSTNCKVNSRILGATLRNSIPELWFVPESANSRKDAKKDLVSSFKPAWNGHGVGL